MSEHALTDGILGFARCAVSFRFSDQHETNWAINLIHDGALWLDLGVTKPAK